MKAISLPARFSISILAVLFGYGFPPIAVHAELGADWTLATSGAQWAERYCFPAVAYGDEIWVIGGRTGSYNNDVWYSSAPSATPTAEPTRTPEPTATPPPGLSPSYSTYLGGSSDDYARAIEIGTNGTAYIAGYTGSDDFPVLSSWQSTRNGSYDLFVCRTTLTGSGLIYSTYLGGSGNDYAFGIALGTGGEAYVSGSTYSSDFPTANPYQASIGGNLDVLVVELSSSGSALIYSTYLGGSDVDNGRGGIVLGTAGEAYVSGYTQGSDFPTTASYQTSNNGAFDAFVIRLFSSGSALVYSTYLGGSGNDYSAGIALSTTGEACIEGHTSSSDLPVANPYQATHGGGTWDVFVSSLASSGSSLAYSTYLGGSGDDTVDGGIALGDGGEAYLTGATAGGGFPTVNPYQESNGGGVDVFVSRLSSSGSALLYSTFLGGSVDDYGYGIALGTGGDAHVEGFTQSINFPTSNPCQPSSAGGWDIFVSRLSSFGSALLYSTYLGGSGDDFGNGGIFLGAGGATHIAGQTNSSDFPTWNPYQSSYAGGTCDGFVSRLIFVPTPTLPPQKTPTPTPEPTRTPEPTATPTAEPTKTPQPSATPTPKPSLTPQKTATPTPEPSLTPVKTATPTPEPTLTPQKTPTSTPAKTATPLTPTPQPTNTPAATPSPSPTCGPILPPQKNVVASGDYNGDGTAELAIFRPSSGLWSIRDLTSSYYGISTDQAAPGDYDGDGSADIAVFRPGSGQWFVRNFTRLYYGTSGDITVPGDYDGHGVADMTVFRPSTGRWYIKDQTSVVFGMNGDWPVPGDYDAGGSLQMAVYRPTAGYWAVSGLTRFFFGGSNDWPLSIDYDGDGICEPAVFRPCDGMWAIRGITRHYLGICTDWARPGDYDGDGVDDLAIFRDCSSLWAVRDLTRVYFGATGDIPVTR